MDATGKKVVWPRSSRINVKERGVRCSNVGRITSKRVEIDVKMIMGAYE